MTAWKAGTVIVAGLLACLAMLATPRATAQAAPPQAGLAAATAGPYLPPALTGTEWERLPTSEPVVALTFDAGANADGVPSILATLRQYGVPATFFLTGQWVQSFPASAGQIAASRSYAIGNHSYDHPDFTTLTDAQVRAEVAQAESAIAGATGRDTHPLFRFPFGARDARTIGIVNSMGYGSIRWTVDTLGWQGTSGGQSEASVVSRVMNAASAGEIVLMHVGSAPDGSTLDASALPAVIQGLQARGFRFVNLADSVRELRVDAFARGLDGAVWHQWWNGRSWVGWESLGGLTPADSGPAAASWGYNRLDVFVRGVDGGLWHRWWDGTGWSGWEPLGGILTSGPAVTARDYRHLDVFARGLDSGLWVKSWDGASWSGWTPLGGILTAAPAVSANSPSMLTVFVRGLDNGLWWRVWVEHGGYTDWAPLGGILTSGPAATVAGTHVYVFVRGTDTRLWHLSGDSASSRWSGWTPLGGILTSGPAADSRSSTAIDVFVRGGDNALYTMRGDGTSWTGWTWLGGTVTSGPASAA
jgi:peptidoglycan/xylan/chitin deacetylase (PgdA/CDA1 family)